MQVLFLLSHKIVLRRLVPVGGVDTLVIDLPAGNYENCGQYCIVVRTLPANVTVNMPVAISIGGVTTTAPAPATVSVERATTATVRAAKPKTADNVTISANTVTVNKEAK